MNQNKNTVLIILGPTASGKTALSLQLANYYQTSIISADSRQCCQELNIGVAKPTDEELNSVHHYFINTHSITQNITAQTFEEYALQAADEIFKTNPVAVMAGGSGLYIKAFCEGFDEIPEVDKNIRQKIIACYKEHGLAWLRKEVNEKDFEFWQEAEQQNPQRLIRALEVLQATGKSISTFRNNEKKKRPFDIIKIGLSLPKEQLHINIDKRINEMIENGLVDEVRALLPYYNYNALQTVGYKEIFDYLDEKNSLQEAIANIKTNTKQYAKRQLTWFRKDKDIHWLSPPFNYYEYSLEDLLKK
ncbi:MAG: tRNA (adenosine(37)-N6)-dimethylallyltransferase MiaA [Parafilimonas sp.]